MLLMALPFVSGWLLLALTGTLELSDPAWFYAGRATTGFGAGSFALAAPIYILEISEVRIRGSLGILMQFMVTSGNVFVNGIGSVLDWEYLTWIVVAFPCLMAAMVFFMPESPYALLAKGREEQARRSLSWLRGGGDYDVEPEMERMKEALEAQKGVGSITLRDLLIKGVYLNPFLIMMTIHGVQQFCGINVIVFYLTDIFLKAGFDIDNSLASSALVSLTQVAATGAAIFIVERTGRKILLVISR